MMNEVEERMMYELEAARKFSEEYGMITYALSNGQAIIYTISEKMKDDAIGRGWWICSIFENGHRVEA